MSDSRFIHYDHRKLPKQKRTIPVWGASSPGGGWGPGPDQSNVLFRCWNCGHTCNTNQNELGESVGYVVRDEVRKTNPRLGTGNINDVSLSIGVHQSGVRLAKLDNNGDPEIVVHNFMQSVFSGCPMCGSKNFK